MDLLNNLGLGFQTALSLQNLAYAFFGAVLGTLIGVLPGLGPVATIAMLLPSIYTLDATPALIMLAGIYYGAQYGGSTTAILINVPGESSSVVTAIDGYQMARRGRAGPGDHPGWRAVLGARLGKGGPRIEHVHRLPARPRSDRGHAAGEEAGGAERRAAQHLGVPPPGACSSRKPRRPRIPPVPLPRAHPLRARQHDAKPAVQPGNTGHRALQVH